MNPTPSPAPEAPELLPCPVCKLPMDEVRRVRQQPNPTHWQCSKCHHVVWPEDDTRATAPAPASGSLVCNQCGAKPENEEDAQDGWDCECGGTLRLAPAPDVAKLEAEVAELKAVLLKLTAIYEKDQDFGESSASAQRPKWLRDALMIYGEAKAEVEANQY